MREIFVAASIAFSSFNSAQVIEVHDGDTFFVRLPDLPAVFGERIGVRIKGIDTPELTDKRACAKKIATTARDFLGSHLDPLVDLHFCEREKYFRILCSVTSRGEDIGTLMMENHLALSYGGGTKIKWKCR